MILSHKHKFIFLHNGKTAGTSTEFALSEICGPEDIITPSRHEEHLRRGRKPQNYRFRPLPWHQSLRSLAGLKIRNRRRWEFYSHMTASAIKERVGDEIWSSYFKFTTERNPWDKMVSAYFHRISAPKHKNLKFDDFIRQAYEKRPDPCELYTINGAIAVDHICRFERLHEDLAETLRKIGVNEQIDLPRAKSRHRQGDKRHYREFYTDETRRMVAEWYAPVIKALGYEF